MFKSKLEKRVLNGIQAYAHSGEEIHNVLVGQASPFGNVPSFLFFAAFMVSWFAEPRLMPIAFLASAPFALYGRLVALVLTDRALYVGRLRRGRDFTDVEIFMPGDPSFPRSSSHVTIDGKKYQVNPLYATAGRYPFLHSMKAMAQTGSLPTEPPPGPAWLRWSLRR